MTAITTAAPTVARRAANVALPIPAAYARLLTGPSVPSAIPAARA